MRFRRKKLIRIILIITILNNAFNSVFSLPVVLPTTAILLPNIGQYLSLIQILVLKLVIWTQIMRLLGLEYEGKGIKSIEPEEVDLEALDKRDEIAGKELDGVESQTLNVQYLNKIESVFKTMQYSRHHDCLIRLMCEIGAHNNDDDSDDGSDDNHLYSSFRRNVIKLFRNLGKPTPGSAQYSYHIAFNIGVSTQKTEMCANTFIRCPVYTEQTEQIVNIGIHLISSLFPDIQIAIRK